MNLFKSLIMALVLLVGGLYVWRYEMGPSAKESKEDDDSKPLFASLEIKNIKDVAVSYDGESYGITKSDDGKWLMVEPAGAETDKHNVNDILQSIGEAKIYNTLGKEDIQEDKSVYGLATPEMTLVFNDGASEHKLELGKKHSFSSRRYAQLSGDEHVYLVGNETFESFKKTRTEVRDRNPFKFDVKNVTSLSITRSGEADAKFVRENEDEWFLKSGAEKFRADSQLVEQNLRNLTGLTVKDFIDSPEGDLSVYGFADPRLMVSVELAGKEASTIVKYIVGEVFKADDNESSAKKSAPGFFVKASDSPIVYRFEHRFYNDLLQPIDHFRAKDLLTDLDVAAVNSLKVINGAQSYTLSRTNQGGKSTWLLTKEEGENPAVPADGAIVDGYLDRVKTLRVLSYPLLSPEKISEQGFQAPVFQLELNAFSEGTQITKQISLGKELLSASTNPSGGDNVINNEDFGASGGGAEQPPRYAQFILGNGEETVAVVSSATVSDLEQPASYFEQKTKKAE